MTGGVRADLADVRPGWATSGRSGGPTLCEVTEACFGSSSERLLGAGAVMPLTDPSKPKACVISGAQANGFYDHNTRDFHGLAIINGPRSGITVWDFDDLTELSCPVEPPNVRTARGCHVYTEWAGEGRGYRVHPGLDILGEGGIAVFYAPGEKTFLHSTFTDLGLLRAQIPDRQTKRSRSTSPHTEES